MPKTTNLRKKLKRTVVRAAPNNVDLKNFGDKVKALEDNKQDNIKVAYIKDIKVNGLDGGTFTSVAWQTRDLNTLEDPDSIVTSLSSNQFTLPPGKYKVIVNAPAYSVNQHKAKIRNITDSSDIFGIGLRADNTSKVANISKIYTTLNISESKVFEIQHYCQTTQSTNGFGQVDASVPGEETFTTIEKTKIG